ncbi:cell surface-associated protein autolysin [Streptococcus equinus]|uniref:GBS Bsp-like repeat-containing protein n=1 Tax=Streptococcus equinus TaxID=1335 RepID=UPI000F6EF036|nr:GBS Bsp-like repeat-containing protein [Streptococcus equinus]VEE22524.1 cell surface-associated protein autolysin [Streptococcus equinus]
MKIKGHGTIKKSKAYGVIGTLLLSAALIVSFGNESVSADEVTNTSSNVIENVSNVENQIDSPLTETADSFTATTNDGEVSKTNETVDNNQSNSTSQSSTIATTETSDSSQILKSDDVISDTSKDDVSNEVISEPEKQNESPELDNSDTITETTLKSSKQDQVTSDYQIILKADKKGATGSAMTETTSAALTAKGFDLQYNEAITPGAKIMFAVWSEANGQDDLIWYTADSNGHAIAKYTGTYGLYNIHTYQNLNGQMKGLNGRTIDVPKPSAKVSIVKASDTTYKVTVSDVPAYITSIQLPTWTEKGGQDDIQWYGTTYNSDGTFTKTFSVAEHNFESGKYNVHYYGISSVTNTLTGLGGTSFNCDYQFGDIAITAKAWATGIEITMPQDIAKVANVSHAVWSEVKGQDDLKWYSDTTGHVVAPYTGDYGTYFVDTYANVKGQMICIGSTTIDIPKPSAKVSIVKESGTTYKVIVSDVPVYITSVQLPTWTAKNDQDDTIWYTAERQSDGTFTKTFSVAEHNFESGKYNVHYYGISSVTNTLTGLGGTSFNCDYQFGDIAITAKAWTTGIEITMPQDIAKVANVSHAVWSEVKGQDDLKWYSDTTGHVVAPYTGDYGTYFVDTYANVKGQMICIGSTTIDIPKPSAKVSIVKESGTTYKVIVSDVPVYITSVQLPTWTAKNDQDDTIWYTAERQSDGTFTKTFSVAEHNFESGKYNVHYYGISSVTNTLTGLGGTSFNCDYQFGDIAITAKAGATGIEITMPQEIAKVANVSHAVWSKVRGQDDLKWYSDTTGHVVAPYTGDYGTYFVDTYANVKGQMICIGSTTIDIPKPEVTVHIEKATDYSAKITVTDVPIYIHDIQLPTWTSKNNQDDIKWYHATKQADGSYVYTFYAKNHRFESGHYNVHVYGTSEVTHSFVCLSGSDGIDLIFDESLTNPTVTVQNHDSKRGTLQVVIAETENSKDIQSVTVAAWSDPNQKNLHWYNSAKVVNGRVIINVDEKYHHNISADYTIHVYVKTKDGETKGYNLGQYALNNKQVTASVSTNYKGTGIYGVNISGVYSSGTVKYAVWSEVNGQNDIRWYDATTSGTNATGLINVANHSGTGTYHIHVYQSDNGQMYFLTSTDFTVKRTNYNTPYYNQRDGRWGGNRYGYYTLASTGCVPTSLAMVFSSLTGNEVLPTTVASYLYNNTVEFNRGTEGTTGNGILVASRQWGLTPTVINSSAALTSALKEGHHVVAAVQQDKFSPWGWGTSHEIVLKGYSNGNTYVYDPYNASNNGWYSIELLWREQSTQAVDVNGLGHPFVKIVDV